MRNIRNNITRTINKSRRLEPEDYLENINNFLMKLTDDHEYFGPKKFARHEYIALMIVELVTPALGEIGREMSVNNAESDVFSQIDALHRIITEMLEEFDTVQNNMNNEQKEGARAEMYVLASKLSEAIRAGKAGYKEFIKTNNVGPVNTVPAAAANAGADNLNSLLSKMTSMKLL